MPGVLAALMTSEPGSISLAGRDFSPNRYPPFGIMLRQDRGLNAERPTEPAGRSSSQSDPRTRAGVTASSGAVT
jgi:hypothetical protein